MGYDYKSKHIEIIAGKIKKMSEIELNFKIYGISVKVLTNSEELSSRVEKDFGAFTYHEGEGHNSFLTIESNFKVIPKEILPNVKPTFNRKHVVTYDIQDERINDYKGKLLSLMNFEKEYAVLYSVDIEILHEVTYLLILSRTAKMMDQKGYHKIHGMGFNYQDKSVVVMMNSGGGKSTLLLNILKQNDVEILSDDTPIINENGVFSGFPLRIGLKARDSFLEEIVGEQVYTMNRQTHGLKYLYPVVGNKLKPVFEGKRKQILIVGLRDNFSLPEIKKITKAKMFYFLFIHQIIGIGLPIIFEYFWEKGIGDFFVKTMIFIKRLKAAVATIFKSEIYEMNFSNEPDKNADYLINFLKNK